MGKSTFFVEQEKAGIGQSYSLAEILDQMPWNEHGLVPAIAQQYDSKEVLMMAWMNRASLEETLSTGQVCYWSRSRQTFWRKGESSGQVQRLKEMRLDCDGDTLLALVDQQGAACHTGRRDCFYYQLTQDKATICAEPIVDPESLYKK